MTDPLTPLPPLPPLRSPLVRSQEEGPPRERKDQGGTPHRPPHDESAPAETESPPTEPAPVVTTYDEQGLTIPGGLDDLDQPHVDAWA
ncbi:hypothetical protein [Aquabacterium sp.]|uniref:hypothetical protein n=1 Tax=Aquabacterium sp. TaxID=1872578 RepID=UPI0035AF43C6